MLLPYNLSCGVHKVARDWTDSSNFCSDMELVQACAANATNPCDAPGSDASIFEPTPSTIHQVLEILDPAIHAAWIHAYRKEFFTLLKSNTFILDILYPSEKCIPILGLNKVKILSDGTLDKLKNHILVQGDFAG